MIERYHLEILRAVDRTGTLNGAAKSLHVTQSALSQSIKKLETLAGVVIWEKSGRNIRLTEAGVYLLDLAKRLLPQLENGEKTLQKYGEGSRGTLRIGMECHPCYRWLLQSIAPYLEEWQGVDVDVRKQFSFEGVAALFQYEIDILVTPDPIEKKGLIFLPVFDYEQVLVVHARHRFAARPFITPGDMHDEKLLSYPVENERLDIFRNFMTPAGILPKQHSYIEDTDMLLQMVASGRGVSAIPLWLVDEMKENFAITAVSLGEYGVHKTIYLGIRDVDNNPAYLTAFVKMIQAQK